MPEEARMPCQWGLYFPWPKGVGCCGFQRSKVCRTSPTPCPATKFRALLLSSQCRPLGFLGSLLLESQQVYNSGLHPQVHGVSCSTYPLLRSGITACQASTMCVSMCLMCPVFSASHFVVQLDSCCFQPPGLRPHPRITNSLSGTCAHFALQPGNDHQLN